MSNHAARAALACFALVLATSSCSRSRSKVPSDPKCAQPRDLAPWIVHWPERAALESALRAGPVVVRYVGCELEILDQCKSTRATPYDYIASAPQKTTELLTDEQQIFRKIPVNGPAIRKESDGADVRLQATTVGTWRTDPHAVDRQELEGKCEDATHVVSGVRVGTFLLSSVRSAADESGTSIEAAGDAQACAKASSLDIEPPTGCAAALRLELSPVKGADASSQSAEHTSSRRGSDRLAKVATLTAVASVVSLGWGAYKVYSANKTISDHCVGNACDAQGVDAAASGRTGAYMVDVGLAGAAGSILLLALFGGGGDSSSDSEARAPGSQGTAASRGRIPAKPRAVAEGSSMRLAPLIRPNGALLGWEARF